MGQGNPTYEGLEGLSMVRNFCLNLVQYNTVMVNSDKEPNICESIIFGPIIIEDKYLPQQLCKIEIACKQLLNKANIFLNNYLAGKQQPHYSGWHCFILAYEG